MWEGYTGQPHLSLQPAFFWGLLVPTLKGLQGSIEGGRWTLWKERRVGRRERGRGEGGGREGGDERDKEKRNSGYKPSNELPK